MQCFVFIKIFSLFSNGPYNDFVKNDIFNMFYEDHVKPKHYVNDIVKSVTPNLELLTSLSDENNFEKRKPNRLTRKKKA